MIYEEEQPIIRTKRLEKRTAKEAKSQAREIERKKALFSRELVIEEAHKERLTKQSENRAAEEKEQLERERVRREAYFAR